MSKRFDIALKHLLETYPNDWLKLLGIEAKGPVKAIDADMATVSPAADKVFRIPDPNGWLSHLEMQANYKADLPDRLHVGSTLLHRRHRLPVQSVAVLLRPEADGRAMTGVLRKKHPPNRQYLEFHYDVLRVWQLPVESILAGGLGILPLAPLCDDSRPQVRAVVKRMQRRLESETQGKKDASISAAAYVLMGLRYPVDLATELFSGVRAMKESTTYQAILAEGREEGRVEGQVKTLRRVLLDLGEQKFGKPDSKTAKKIESIHEYEKLERLVQRVLNADNWKELLQD